jgi:hypothetical protein
MPLNFHDSLNFPMFIPVFFSQKHLINVPTMFGRLLNHSVYKKAQLQVQLERFIMAFFQYWQ